MTRSNGDISNSHLNNIYPHQVALPYEACTGKNYGPPHRLAQSLSVYWRHRHVFDRGQPYLVFCFREPEDAIQFRETFDGVPFFPEDMKGKVWNRPPGDVRRPRRHTRRELRLQRFERSG